MEGTNSDSQCLESSGQIQMDTDLNDKNNSEDNENYGKKAGISISDGKITEAGSDTDSGSELTDKILKKVVVENKIENETNASKELTTEDEKNKVNQIDDLKEK